MRFLPLKTKSKFRRSGQLACVAGAGRGGGIGEIRLALERKGSAYRGNLVNSTLTRVQRKGKRSAAAHDKN